MEIQKLTSLCVFQVFIKVKIEPVRGPWGYSTTNLNNNSSEQAASVYFGKQTACSKPRLHPLKPSVARTNGSMVCEWHGSQEPRAAALQTQAFKTTLAVWVRAVITPTIHWNPNEDLEEERWRGWRTLLAVLDSASVQQQNSVTEDVEPWG